MKIKIDLSNKTEIVSCDNLEITQKFLKLTNVVVDDLLSSKILEKNYKLVSVISYEILED